MQTNGTTGKTDIDEAEAEKRIYEFAKKITIHLGREISLKSMNGYFTDSPFTVIMTLVSEIFVALVFPLLKMRETGHDEWLKKLLEDFSGVVTHGLSIAMQQYDAAVTSKTQQERRGKNECQ